MQTTTNVIEETMGVNRRIRVKSSLDSSQSWVSSTTFSSSFSNSPSFSEGTEKELLSLADENVMGQCRSYKAKDTRVHNCKGLPCFFKLAFTITLLIISFCSILHRVMRNSFSLKGESHSAASNNFSGKPAFFPRVVRFAPEDDNENRRNAGFTASNYETIRLDMTAEYHPSSRKVRPIGNFEKQGSLEESDDLYAYKNLNPDITDDCQLRYEWQERAYPTCNSIHEFDSSSPFLGRFYDNKLRRRYQIVGHGYWRDVWIVSQAESLGYSSVEEQAKVVFKSMRFKHEFTPRNFDRNRRDAIIMDRMTSSENVIDIYGFCGTSSFSEYGEGGDIAASIWPSKADSHQLTKLEKLHIATQAAIALADLHNVDAEGHPSVAHTDISPNQYIKVNDRYKLNDFNRARFIPWSESKDEACSYYVGTNPGKNRAPEEYKLEAQSEKVDIYSLGNIFYMLLQGEYPFSDVDTEEAQKLVIEGHRPSFYFDVWNSTDPIDQALKSIMIRCHEQIPSDRPSAREVETFLKQKMRQLDPGRLEKWTQSRQP